MGGISMRILISDWGALEDVLPIAFIYQVGLEVLEFASPENLDQASSLVEDIRQKVSGIPLLGMHGPFTELVPASRDPMVRQVARTRFQQGYEVSQRLCAQHLVLHSGFFPKTYPRDQWIQNSYDFWVDFLADKPATNRIHMENVYEDDFTALQELIDRVNERLQAEILSICLDIGHVYANSSKTVADWITGLGDRIRYTHLHNNDGILDDHWRLDNGRINVSEVLDLLSKHSPNSVWTIETIVSDIEPSLLWMQEQGYL
jgi:sugar phosphate isomerase/epimerase